MGLSGVVKILSLYMGTVSSFCSGKTATSDLDVDVLRGTRILWTFNVFNYE